MGAAVRQKLAGHVPVFAQVTGGGTALAGVFLLFGLGVTLIVGGVVLLALGTLREAKVI